MSRNVSSQRLKPCNLSPHPVNQRLGETIEPLQTPVIRMAHQVKAAGQADLVGQQADTADASDVMDAEEAL